MIVIGYLMKRFNKLKDAKSFMEKWDTLVHYKWKNANICNPRLAGLTTRGSTNHAILWHDIVAEAWRFNMMLLGITTHKVKGCGSKDDIIRNILKLSIEINKPVLETHGPLSGKTMQQLIAKLRHVSFSKMYPQLVKIRFHDNEVKEHFGRKRE